MSFHPNSGSSNKARTAAMTEMYRAGRTLQEIGETFHISRERVRQCLTAAGRAGRDEQLLARACGLRASQKARPLAQVLAVRNYRVGHGREVPLLQHEERRI